MDYIHNHNARATAVTVLSALLTLVIGGCATSSMHGQHAPADGNSGLEEIVVTGSAAPRDAHGARGAERAKDASRRATGQARESSSAQQRGLAQVAAPNAQGIIAARMQRDELVARLSPEEELWVIAQPETTPAVDTNIPGSGALMTQQGGQEVPLPLQHTTVNASIDGYISTVSVEQKFHNPFNAKIEAVYLFPLPEKSAINEFLMIIGERRIRGILRKKEEAQTIYNEARRQGHRASLLVQHRPNVFEQKVANIEPGEAIDVKIRYFHTLNYRDGWYSFIFPTVVGPRFNPPGTANPIAAVPQGGTGTGTSIHYLRPQDRSGHDLSISVDLEAGSTIEEIRATHAIDTERRSASSTRVNLTAAKTILNRDFILQFRVEGEQLRSSLRSYKPEGSDEGYFTLMLHPPSSLNYLPRVPMELIFVIDASGSMNGRPIEQAKAAVIAGLDLLQPDDSFQLIRFSESASQLGPMPLAATPENIAHAKQQLRSLSGGGGTMMIEGIKAALDFHHDPARERVVAFLTDGYIGNEPEILAAVHEKLGSARIFSFGVGASVNRYLMERMALLGRGAVAYLGPQNTGAAIMTDFFHRISHPALTDIDINWGNATVTDTYPRELPDLFLGRPVVISGKFAGSLDNITVSGYAGFEQQHYAIRGVARDNGNIATLWARHRIADLANRLAYDADPELRVAITNTALKHQLMSDYTSYVAVDAANVTNGDYGVTVHQAVTVPDGVRYETTVNQDGT